VRCAEQAQCRSRFVLTWIPRSLFIGRRRGRSVLRRLRKSRCRTCSTLRLGEPSGDTATAAIPAADRARVTSADICAAARPLRGRRRRADGDVSVSPRTAAMVAISVVALAFASFGAPAWDSIRMGVALGRWPVALSLPPPGGKAVSDLAPTLRAYCADMAVSAFLAAVYRVTTTRSAARSRRNRLTARPRR
jgi:hypothetical protein